MEKILVWHNMPQHAHCAMHISSIGGPGWLFLSVLRNGSGYIARRIASTCTRRIAGTRHVSGSGCVSSTGCISGMRRVSSTGRVGVSWCISSFRTQPRVGEGLSRFLRVTVGYKTILGRSTFPTQIKSCRLLDFQICRPFERWRGWWLWLQRLSLNTRQKWNKTKGLSPSRSRCSF